MLLLYSFVSFTPPSWFWAAETNHSGKMLTLWYNGVEGQKGCKDGLLGIYRALT